MALAQLLAPGSTIYAVDLDRKTLEGIPDQHNGVEIRKIVGDLQSFSLRLQQVDGILMAIRCTSFKSSRYCCEGFCLWQIAV